MVSLHMIPITLQYFTIFILFHLLPILTSLCLLRLANQLKPLKDTIEVLRMDLRRMAQFVRTDFYLDFGRYNTITTIMHLWCDFLIFHLARHCTYHCFFIFDIWFIWFSNYMKIWQTLMAMRDESRQVCASTAGLQHHVMDNCHWSLWTHM